MGLTQEVAKFVAQTRRRDIPEDVAQLARGFILDGLGVALAGSTDECSRIVQAQVRQMGGKGEVAWAYTKGLPFVPSPIVYRDRLYMLKDGPFMTCLDAKTGKPVYEAERVKAGPRAYASPVAANGHIYIAALDGTVTVIVAGEDAPDVAYSVKLGEPVRATPAIAHHTLYIRSDKFLYAFASK